jgi:poly-gamma-glutamate system protein
MTLAGLLLCAAAAIAVWRIAEEVAMRREPDAASLQNAADIMRRATAVIRDAKIERGLLQDKDLDPNRTGLVGPEWSETVTTIGSLSSKRTLTNPDTAALFSRLFHTAGLRPGDPVAVVLSGSFVGGNVAVLSAIESYGLRAAVVSSLGASMYGAADPTFTWLDMEAAVREAGVWQVRSRRALLGGESGMARDLDDDARRALSAAAERSSVPLIKAESFADAVRETAAVVGLGPGSETKPTLLINVGGSQLALGDCLEAAEIPYGLIARPLPCREGTPGLIQVALAQGVQVLNAFKIRQFARHYGLPADPVPLPEPGRNPLIYIR